MLDVHYASEALVGFFRRSDAEAIGGYSAKALAWVLGVEVRAVQLVAELDYIASSRAAQRVLAENYVGLPV